MLEKAMSHSVLDRFSELNVVCIGDLMLDRFVYGDASRISPEAPIPVVRQSRVLETLGGVGNAARNLRELGANVTMIAVAGVDMAASDVRERMSEAGMSDAHIFADPNRRTSEKIRIIARQQQMLRLDAEDTDAISAELETRVCAGVTEALANAHAVILSDYGKGVLTGAVISHIIQTAKSLNIPVLVDPKGSDYTIYKGATLVTPNMAELSLATGYKPKEGDMGFVEAARALAQKCALDAVVVTRSKDGMSVIETGEDAVTHLPAQAREVYDVSGAGDTVIAVLALGLAAGLSLPEAAVLANAAGGVVVAKLGTATLNRHELATALALGADKGKHGKIMGWGEAEALVHDWKARGLTVVTTNGAYDIIHEGHVTLLEQAKALGDRLVVLLNSDDSIKRYKSPTRPLNPQSARCKVMAAIGVVDAVVVFGHDADEDDKPLKILELLKPDIHVKGGDYEVEKLPETAVVRRNGGEVAIIPFVDGFSTTSILEKARA